MEKIDKFHVGIAAEAFAAGIFALCGYDVSVQYGANQPGYDLIIAKGEKILKVSVKGNQTGAWTLTQKYLDGTNYHEAADKWFEEHDKKTILCFVQFKDIELDNELNALPKIYLATPEEVRDILKSTGRRGASHLNKSHVPDDWKFSKGRIEELFERA